MCSMAAIGDAVVLSPANARNPTPQAVAARSPGAVCFSVRRQVGALPGFKGLKTQTMSSASWGSKSSSASRSSRNGRVVCEAQGATALDLSPVNDITWKSLVLEADGPVLVEFWAPWCGPCRIIHPVVGELASEYAGKLKCFKLNTDESPSIATRYGVRSVPTIMIFSNGEKKDSVLGAVPKTTLTACIEKFL